MPETTLFKNCWNFGDAIPAVGKQRAARCYVYLEKVTKVHYIFIGDAYLEG